MASSEHGHAGRSRAEAAKRGKGSQRAAYWPCPHTCAVRWFLKGPVIAIDHCPRSLINVTTARAWRNGRREGLKHPFLTECRFESDRPHQKHPCCLHRT